MLFALLNMIIVHGINAAALHYVHNHRANDIYALQIYIINFVSYLANKRVESISATLQLKVTKKTQEHYRFTCRCGHILQ